MRMRITQTKTREKTDMDMNCDGWSSRTHSKGLYAVSARPEPRNSKVNCGFYVQRARPQRYLHCFSLFSVCFFRVFYFSFCVVSVFSLSFMFFFIDFCQWIRRLFELHQSQLYWINNGQCVSSESLLLQFADGHECIVVGGSCIACSSFWSHRMVWNSFFFKIFFFSSLFFRVCVCRFICRRLVNNDAAGRALTRGLSGEQPAACLAGLLNGTIEPAEISVVQIVLNGHDNDRMTTGSSMI